MLIVLLHNDGTGRNGMAHYDCEVRVNERVIGRGRIAAHRQADGWRTLLHRLADELPSTEGQDGLLAILAKCTATQTVAGANCESPTGQVS